MLKLLGLKTTKEAEVDTEAKIKLVAENYAEVLERMKVDYNKSLDQITKEYNEKLDAAKGSIDALKKEVDDLYNDIALALDGQKLPDRKMMVVNYPSPLAHTPVENTETASSLAKVVEEQEKKAQEMIELLEKKIKSLPANAKGRGGIDLIDQDGNHYLKSFSTKEELEGILADAKAGKVTIAEQSGW